MCSITHRFSKVVGLIPGVDNIPSSQRKKNITTRGVVVSFFKEVILTTLEELAEFVENEEEPPIF